MLLDKDMMVQVQEIKSIALKLKNLGFPLSEEYQVIMILIALPHEWSTLHTIILNKSGPSPSKTPLTLFSNMKLHYSNNKKVQ